MRLGTMDRILGLCGLMLLLCAGSVLGGEKKLMHCFYFTPMEHATPADWQAFYKATDELPSKIPGLTHVWAGKLMRPGYIITGDPDAMAKLRAGNKDVPGKLNVNYRDYGVCMEMENADVLKAYSASPAHKNWQALYEKVRQPGTSSFDISGQ